MQQHAELRQPVASYLLLLLLPYTLLHFIHLPQLPPRQHR
jgi:hypothetical protein